MEGKLEQLGYGYQGKLESLRKKEFSRLDTATGDHKRTYLDHAGATLYGEAQLAASMKQLCANTYANPHSQGRESQRTTKAVDDARQRVLKHLNTDASK